MKNEEGSSGNNPSSYYTILTNTGVIFDDDGEAVSLTKISRAINSGLYSLQPCAGRSEEELKWAYRQEPESQFTQRAALVIVEPTDSERLSVVSCSLFSTGNQAQQHLNGGNQAQPKSGPSCLVC